MSTRSSAISASQLLTSIGRTSTWGGRARSPGYRGPVSLKVFPAGGLVGLVQSRARDYGCRHGR